jgi:hypothetical protein
VSPYVRTVNTGSGATAVQIVHSSRRGSRDIEHIGSAHDDVQVEVLKAAARQRLTAGQGELDLGLERTEPARRGAGGGPLPPLDDGPVTHSAVVTVIRRGLACRRLPRRPTG